jgi:hypothetical protein
MIAVKVHTMVMNESYFSVQHLAPVLEAVSTAGTDQIVSDQSSSGIEYS